MATFSKTDPECVSTDRIIFVGNVQLQTYTESDPLYQVKPATLELAIDVIARPPYESVTFHDIILILDILEPAGAEFVEHSGRNNYYWGVPRTTPSGEWDEVSPGAATSRLRIRTPTGRLLSGPNNGATYYVGIAGAPADSPLKFTAVASATQVHAVASSCAITIADLHARHRLGGYLPPLS